MKKEYVVGKCVEKAVCDVGVSVSLIQRTKSPRPLIKVVRNEMIIFVKHVCRTYLWKHLLGEIEFALRNKWVARRRIPNNGQFLLPQLEDFSSHGIVGLGGRV